MSCLSKRGRKNILTKKRRDIIVASLRCGNTRRASAHLAGIHECTLVRWLNRGREAKAGDSAYMDLLACVQKAEAAAESSMLSAIVDAVADNWQAAAWYLERRYPAEYGRHTKVAVSADLPVEIVVEIGGRRDDDGE